LDTDDDFWASRDCRGIYRAGQWIIRKTRNVLGKEKTKNASKEKTKNANKEIP
jgi:hypothetical protein